MNGAEHASRAVGRSHDMGEVGELREMSEVRVDFRIFVIPESEIIDGVHSRLLSSVCVW